MWPALEVEVAGWDVWAEGRGSLFPTRAYPPVPLAASCVLQWVLLQRWVEALSPLVGRSQGSGWPSRFVASSAVLNVVGVSGHVRIKVPRTCCGLRVMGSISVIAGIIAEFSRVRGFVLG